jgi:hypothetical protein
MLICQNRAQERNTFSQQLLSANDLPGIAPAFHSAAVEHAMLTPRPTLDPPENNRRSCTSLSEARTVLSCQLLRGRHPSTRRTR